MKQGISRIKRGLLIFLSTLLLASSVLLCVIFVEDSTMRVEYQGKTQEYFIPFYDRDVTRYEDSELFEFLYTSSTEDIIRMCVIKNQMETDGAYDASKEIDIAAFANRESGMYENLPTALFYLDDLIKWGNKGFTFKTVSAETVPFDTNGQPVEILVSRYRSVEGKDLLSYAQTLEQYNSLVSYLIDSAQSLFFNYVEYEEYKKSYGVGKTNILYCIQMNNDGKIIRYTNMDNIDIDMTVDAISTNFINQEKYIYFNPDKMMISTNLKMSAQQMKEIVSPYEYSFSDNSRTWLGFDNTYSASDSFANGKEYYDGKTATSHGMGMIVAIWITFFTYLSIIVFLITKEGRIYIKKKNETAKSLIVEDVVEEVVIEDLGEDNITKKVNKQLEAIKNGIVLRKIDHMPIEFMLILTFAIIVVVLVGGGMSGKIIYHNIFGGIYIYAMTVCTIFVCHYLTLPTLLCFVRRIKAKNLSDNSCTKWLFNLIKQKTIDAYDHGHAFIRTWIPYLIFLLMNLIFIMLAPIGLIVAVIVDLVVGFILYKGNKERQEIVESINIISNGDIKHQMDAKNMHGDNLELCKAVNHIGDGIRKAVETSMKDEKMKADLITNVSHDIKTPLTSIISYVDLLKRENIQDEKIKSYINVLDQKSQRLKQLTDDLVEASKISSGNIVLNFEKINLVELVNQSIGEFEDKFANHGLKCRFVPEQNPVFVNVDARSMFRIIENLYNNIYKYALQGTRVYIDMNIIGTEGAHRVQLAFKNISENQLNMTAEELLERFKQGDESRKSEGSGLGLSIAKSLTEAMNGQFDIFLDGDLFKIILTFNTI